MTKPQSDHYTPSIEDGYAIDALKDDKNEDEHCGSCETWHACDVAMRCLGGEVRAMNNTKLRAIQDAIDARLKYWLCHDLKSGWTTIGPCCDKCRLTNPQGNMAMLCGCRDPFQIECECHIPARKAVKDYMIQELTAILKDAT